MVVNTRYVIIFFTGQGEWRAAKKNDFLGAVVIIQSWENLYEGDIF